MTVIDIGSSSTCFSQSSRVGFHDLIRSATPAHRGSTTYSNSSKLLLMTIRRLGNDMTEKRAAHAMARSVTTLASSLIGLPSSSKGGDMLNAYNIDAQARNSEASARWRPGQILSIELE